MSARRRTQERPWPAHWFIVLSNTATYGCGLCGAAWMFVNLKATLELVLLDLGMLGLTKGLATLERMYPPSSSSSGSQRSQSS